MNNIPIEGPPYTKPAHRLESVVHLWQLIARQPPQNVESVCGSLVVRLPALNLERLCDHISLSCHQATFPQRLESLCCHIWRAYCQANPYPLPVFHLQSVCVAICGKVVIKLPP
jgi:hypothetical protein